MESIGITLSLLDRAVQISGFFTDPTNTSKLAKKLEEDIERVRTLALDVRRDLNENVEQAEHSSMKTGFENLERVFMELRDCMEHMERLKSKYFPVESMNTVLRLQKMLFRIFGARELIQGLTSMSKSVGRIQATLLSISKVESDISDFYRLKKISNILEASETEDMFTPSFAMIPVFSFRDAVLDFGEINDEPVTVEAQLKKLVLMSTSALCEAAGSSSMNVKGGSGLLMSATGMGGTGKTCALRGLTYDADVRARFSDGIYFMSVGRQASAFDLLAELADIVMASGGKQKSKEMLQSITLEHGAHIASRWFQQRHCLFLFDDVWRTESCAIGFLRELKIIVQFAFESRIVISTRDSKIASQARKQVVVEFGPRDPVNAVSRQILLAAANLSEDQVQTGDGKRYPDFDRVLELCSGLPLALAVAGSQIAEMMRENGERNVMFVLRTYIKKLTRDDASEYGGLHAVLDSCLDCADRQYKAREDVHAKYSLREMFESLCIARKQAWLPDAVLAKLWGLDESNCHEVAYTMSRFCLVSYVPRKWKVEEEEKVMYSVSLHDLVLHWAAKQADINKSTEQWHRRFLDGYFKGGSIREEAVCCKDDGYIVNNLARHLAASGQREDLQMVLCDVRWAMTRAKMGSWLDMRADFGYLGENWQDTSKGLKRVHSLLDQYWSLLEDNSGLFPFYVFCSLSLEERTADLLRNFLDTLYHHFPRPWLQPLHKLSTPDASSPIHQIALFNNKLPLFAFSTYEDIRIWSTSKQQVVLKIPHDSTCIAATAKGMMIVSGSKDHTLQRWDAYTGKCIGDSLRGHTSRVACVAVSSNIIVSASWDKTLRRWDAYTGECIGDPLRGHTSWVQCVTVSEDEKMIVSGSIDGTLRRWNTQTGACIGDPLLGHTDAVQCVAVSGDGTMIVSGSMDGTLRRWDALTGAYIGDPLLGHTDAVQCVAVSEDKKMIVSGSLDGTLRRWDTHTGECIGAPLRGHEGAVQCVAVSGDRTMIMSINVNALVSTYAGV